MTPPQLTRDAPVVHVVDPGEPARFLTLRVNDGVAVAHCVTGRLRQGVDLDPPLQRQARLDRLATALGVADTVQVGTLLGDDAALLGQCFTNLHARLETVHAVELRSGVGDPTCLVHDRGHRQRVPHTHLEVVGVVSRGDLHGTGAELGIDVVVGDDGDLPPGERVLEGGADESLVSLVVGVNRNCGVAEHRFDSGGRDDDMRLGIVERAVSQRDEFALDVLELDLDVGDGGLQHRRPVDQSLGAIDQTVVEHTLEHGLHGLGQAVVHGESLSAPVHTVADASHLPTDGSARFTLPVPDLVDEQLAAELFLGLSVGGELLFHDGLGGDTRVVHARQPQHLVPEHPLATAQRVHQRVVESVTHVQAARDVGWGQHDGVGRLAAGGVGFEVPGVDPGPVQLRLDRTGIPALGQVDRIGGVL